MPKIHWKQLEFLDQDTDDFDVESCPYGRKWLIEKLREFRRTGGMLNLFFQKIGAPHEDPEDPSTWGPQSSDDIDWTGFPD